MTKKENFLAVAHSDLFFDLAINDSRFISDLLGVGESESLAVSNVKRMRNCTDEVACETGEITPGACIPAAAACFVYEAFVSRAVTAIRYQPLVT